MWRILLPAIAIAVSFSPSTLAADKDKDGYVSLFNGKDLTGWVNVNCSPNTWSVKDNEIITSGKPTGYMRSEKQYENFELEFEWMHINKTAVGNSGLFVWGDCLPAVGTGYTKSIEVQVLVNLNVKDTYTSHGDLFSIWGAKCKPDRPHPKGWERCLPSEERAKGGGEWNHYKVIANNGVLKLHVNGKEVSGVSESNPRKGYLALESEGAECHFRNIKIKELPSTNPKPEECASVDKGHVHLLTGVNLDGWKVKEKDWTAGDGVIRCAGETAITTTKEYGSGELVFDWKIPAKSTGKLEVKFPGGSKTFESAKPGSYGRVTLAIPKSDKKAPIEFVGLKGVEIRNIFLQQDGSK